MAFSVGATHFIHADQNTLQNVKDLTDGLGVDWHGAVGSPKIAEMLLPTFGEGNGDTSRCPPTDSKIQIDATGISDKKSV